MSGLRPTPSIVLDSGVSSTQDPHGDVSNSRAALRLPPPRPTRPPILPVHNSSDDDGISLTPVPATLPEFLDPAVSVFSGAPISRLPTMPVGILSVTPISRIPTMPGPGPSLSITAPAQLTATDEITTHNPAQRVPLMGVPGAGSRREPPKKPKIPIQAQVMEPNDSVVQGPVPSKVWTSVLTGRSPPNDQMEGIEITNQTAVKVLPGGETKNKWSKSNAKGKGKEVENINERQKRGKPKAATRPYRDPDSDDNYDADPSDEEEDHWLEEDGEAVRLARADAGFSYSSIRVWHGNR